MMVYDQAETLKSRDDPFCSEVLDEGEKREDKHRQGRQNTMGSRTSFHWGGFVGKILLTREILYRVEQM
jgi:hypothetical protein